MCNEYGAVVDKKVDDMTKQEHSIHHTGASSIAIVVDSGADIPEEYANEIQVVPVRYSFGNQQLLIRLLKVLENFINKWKLIQIILKHLNQHQEILKKYIILFHRIMILLFLYIYHKKLVEHTNQV